MTVRAGLTGREPTIEDVPLTPETALPEIKMSKKRLPKGKGNAEAEAELPSDPLDDILECLDNKRYGYRKDMPDDRCKTLSQVHRSKHNRNGILLCDSACPS
jgi:hypothetical protein